MTAETILIHKGGYIRVAGHTAGQGDVTYCSLGCEDIRARRQAPRQNCMGPSHVPHSSPESEGTAVRPLIIGRSAAIQAICALAERVAEGDAKVLITGESGVGKDLIAQLIHSHPAAQNIRLWQ